MMMNIGKYCRAAAGALVLGLALAAPAHASQFTPEQRGEIEAIVKDYIIRNPEIIREALIALDRLSKQEEDRLRAQAVAELAPQLFRSEHQVVVGNPDGKIQLVEFYDYNCGYCRRAAVDLERLIKSNPDLRVVLKEFPVLGQQSREAAIVSAAAGRQMSASQFWDFHHRLMKGSGRIGQAQALAAARASGADMARLTRDIEDRTIVAGLEEVRALADALSLTGTPSYVVGDEVVVGAVGFERLQSRVENLRKCGKTECE